jgi:hypothetical protein
MMFNLESGEAVQTLKRSARPILRKGRVYLCEYLYECCTG